MQSVAGKHMGRAFHYDKVRCTCVTVLTNILVYSVYTLKD